MIRLHRCCSLSHNEALKQFGSCPFRLASGGVLFDPEGVDTRKDQMSAGVLTGLRLNSTEGTLHVWTRAIVPDALDSYPCWRSPSAMLLDWPWWPALLRSPYP